MAIVENPEITIYLYGLRLVMRNAPRIEGRTAARQTFFWEAELTLGTLHRNISMVPINSTFEGRMNIIARLLHTVCRFAIKSRLKNFLVINWFIFFSNIFYTHYILKEGPILEWVLAFNIFSILSFNLLNFFVFFSEQSP